MGSNPHSKGDLFSRSMKVLKARTEERPARRETKNSVKIIAIDAANTTLPDKNYQTFWVETNCTLVLVKLTEK